jgi:mersacidin/lichenicidin family type 2 lantibiotic
MSRLDIIRAWKDEDYRLSLSEAELALLPDNPAGIIDLSDTDLAGVTGAMLEAAGTQLILTLGCCKGFTSDTCMCTYTCRCGNWTQEVIVCGPSIVMEESVY